MVFCGSLHHQQNLPQKTSITKKPTSENRFKKRMALKMKESADSYICGWFGGRVGWVGGSHLRMVFCGRVGGENGFLWERIRHQLNLPSRPRTTESISGVGGKKVISKCKFKIKSHFGTGTKCELKTKWQKWFHWLTRTTTPLVTIAMSVTDPHFSRPFDPKI